MKKIFCVIVDMTYFCKRLSQLFFIFNSYPMFYSKSKLKELTYLINGACIEVHKATGPGLTEKVYQAVLKQELTLRNIRFSTEQPVRIPYKGVLLDTELRYDLLIEDTIVVELKAVESIFPIHKAQILTYMKLLKIPKGILVNFNVQNLFYEGIQTFVNEYFNELPE